MYVQTLTLDDGFHFNLLKVEVGERSLEFTKKNCQEDKNVTAECLADFNNEATTANLTSRRILERDFTSRDTCAFG